MARNTTPRSEEAAPAAAPEPAGDRHAATLLALRAEFIAKVDELKVLFDRAHDLLHDMQRE